LKLKHHNLFFQIGFWSRNQSPYDVSKQQIGANGKKADLNVILLLPKGFKLASKTQITEEE
jgi:hypothetical protein